MLECVFVIIHVVIVVVGVGKEIVFTSKNKARSEVLQRQEYIIRFFYFIHFLWVVSDVFPLLVPEVRIHVFIAHNFDGVFHADTAVVCSNNHFARFIGEPLQCFPKG